MSGEIEPKRFAPDAESAGQQIARLKAETREHQLELATARITEIVQEYPAYELE